MVDLADLWGRSFAGEGGGGVARGEVCTSSCLNQAATHTWGDFAHTSAERVFRPADLLELAPGGPRSALAARVQAGGGWRETVLADGSRPPRASSCGGPHRRRALA